MKILFILLSLSFACTSFASSDDKIFCSLLNIKRIKAIATTHSTFDKNLHCTVSCMLTLKCGAGEALAMGVLKEIQDLFGPGTADVEDLKADKFGIGLATSQAARTDSQCLEQCDLYYHQ